MKILEFSVSFREEEIARLLFTRNTDGDWILERFWKIVIQYLIEEGADIEFFYDTEKQNMDFGLRNTDRLIYEWDNDRVTFCWQRTEHTIPVSDQGLQNRERLMSIDFITDGRLKAVVQRVYKKERERRDPRFHPAKIEVRGLEPWLSREMIEEAMKKYAQHPRQHPMKDFIIMDDLDVPRFPRIIEHEGNKD